MAAPIVYSVYAVVLSCKSHIQLVPCEAHTRQREQAKGPLSGADKACSPREMYALPIFLPNWRVSIKPYSIYKRRLAVSLRARLKISVILLLVLGPLADNPKGQTSVACEQDSVACACVGSLIHRTINFLAVHRPGQWAVCFCLIEYGLILCEVGGFLCWPSRSINI